MWWESGWMDGYANIYCIIYSDLIWNVRFQALCATLGLVCALHTYINTYLHNSMHDSLFSLRCVYASWRNAFFHFAFTFGQSAKAYVEPISVFNTLVARFIGWGVNRWQSSVCFCNMCWKVSRQRCYWPIAAIHSPIILTRFIDDVMLFVTYDIYTWCYKIHNPHMHQTARTNCYSHVKSNWLKC